MRSAISLNAIQEPIPPNYYIDYLAQDEILDSIGVNINYTFISSDEIYYAFQRSGDWVFPNFILDLEELLELPMRISLFYGDADYICNWFGGEAVSLAANYSGAESFRNAGYAPMMVDGVEYGATREYGNFSFTRIYDSGHEIPCKLAPFSFTYHIMLNSYPHYLWLTFSPFFASMKIINPLLLLLFSIAA